MTGIATARARHRAHHTRQALGAAAFLTCAAALAILGAAACGGSLARPDPATVSVTDYVAVSFPPRPPPIEFIPPSPQKGAVWVDGSWEWDGERYGWRSGRWALPPDGARYARWTVVRRKEDGQLFFAPSTWKDRGGATLDERTFPRLGPAARARSRPNEPPRARRDGGIQRDGSDGKDGGGPADAGDASVVPEQKRPSSPDTPPPGVEGEPD